MKRKTLFVSIVFNVKNWFIRAVPIVVAAAIAIGLLNKPVYAASPNPAMTVVIDAGHGGIDGGVTGRTTGAVESELNLLVAKLLKEDFEAAGFNVVMTRTTSAGLYKTSYSSLKKTDMLNRKRIIEDAGASAVISVHMNECPYPSRRGAQTFHKADDKESNALAVCIQSELDALPESSRSCPVLKGDYYVLNVSPCPAVLVECGFLSNEEDEALLIKDEYREKLSYAIFRGCVKYFSRFYTCAATMAE